jgi:GGDEF domain-containing protein
MVRATERAIEDVRPLGVPLACVRLRFEADGGDPEERVRSGLLSAAQEFAIQSLRPADTVLAIEGQLLLLMRGGTQSTAYAMLDRVLHALVKMLRAGGATSGECNMVFGVAAYPEDGDNAEAILSRAEAELSAFQ